MVGISKKNTSARPKDKGNGFIVAGEELSAVREQLQMWFMAVESAVSKNRGTTTIRHYRNCVRHLKDSERFLSFPKDNHKAGVLSRHLGTSKMVVVANNDLML